MAVERLPASFVLGLLLGWLAYRSGSVWPGMLLHLLHNAFIVLLGYYSPRLVEAGWLIEGQEHLPWPVVAVAMAGMALGGGVLIRLRRREESYLSQARP